MNGWFARKVPRCVMSIFKPANIAIMIMGATGGFIIGLVPVFLFHKEQTVVVSEARETDGIVTQGGRINILVDAKKTRECQIQTARFLWKLVDDPERVGEKIPLIVSLGGNNVSTLPVGQDYRYIVSIALPVDISPGENYYYGSKTVRDCQNYNLLNDKQIVETKPIPIRVITKDEAMRIANESTTKRLD